MILEETNCIFCGKESGRVDWEENGFTGKRCECGLLYVSPRPDAKEIESWYNSDTTNASARSRIRSEIWGRLNALHRLKILTRYKHQGNLLEIGPGNGYFLDESRRFGFHPFGVELNHSKARFIKEQFGIHIETIQFSNASFGGILFDSICHFDVISHFYDPISEFEQYYDRLKEDGILFFETGNGGDLSKGWLKFIGRIQFPQHLFLFSNKNIETLCQNTGFKIIQIHRYSILPHLVAIKSLFWFKNHIYKSQIKMENAGMAQDLSKKQPMNSKWGIFLLKIMILCNLFLRYRIGRWFPKIGPQTIIYVAKKVSIDHE